MILQAISCIYIDSRPNKNPLSQLYIQQPPLHIRFRRQSRARSVDRFRYQAVFMKLIILHLYFLHTVRFSCSNSFSLRPHHINKTLCWRNALFILKNSYLFEHYIFISTNFQLGGGHLGDTYSVTCSVTTIRSSLSRLI